MKKRYVILSIVFLLNSLNATAQISPTDMEAKSSAAQAVELKATQPILRGDKVFRLMFRLKSQNGKEVPYSVLATRNAVFNWSAFTQNGATCEVSHHKVKNVHYIYENNIRHSKSELKKYNGSNGSAGVNRPAMVIADFECDVQVRQGDYLTISTRWYYLIDGTWQSADYVFENAKLSE